MPLLTLSSVVHDSPQVINSALEKLSCSGLGIDEVDIYPAVLSALTAKAAPPGVVDRVREVTHAARRQRSQKTKNAAPSARADVGPSTLRQAAATVNEADSYMETFNVGIAMSLHTVLLSRNRIFSLLGIVQFKHCVRLSLLGNRIRTIEECEPLALLPDLQYLSLEYNPVAQLPHYRAHVLRICSWPHDLTARTCRLRKLDSTAVSSAEVKHASMCLQREAGLLPELLYRTQLLAFVADVERRVELHSELRRRGLVHQEVRSASKLSTMLKRGAAYAQDRVPLTGAAHLVRLLVRDRRQLLTGKSQPVGTHHEAAAVPADNSATDIVCGSDALDDSREVNVSSVPTCSLLSDQSDGDVQILHSLSNLIGEQKELHWSRSTLRRADALVAKGICTEWSRDAFRQALAFLDVRVCTVLLRVARALGTSLNAHDMDHLCQVWMHAVTHHRPTNAEALDMTGPRRLGQAKGVAEVKAKRILPVKNEGLETNSKLYMRPAAQQRQALPLPDAAVAGRLPVEASAEAPKSVWAVGEQDGCLSSSLASLPVVSSDITVDITDISAASVSSVESLLQPRASIPLPTATGTRPRKAPPPSAEEPVLVDPCPAEPRAQTPPPPAEAVPVQTSVLPLIQEAVALSNATVKRHAFQQWCTALRHRWQSRIAVAFIHDKVAEASVQHRSSLMRSPSWSGLLTHITYLERKRGFFNCWRHRAERRRARRSQDEERVSQLWRTHRAESQLRCTQRELVSAKELAMQHVQHVLSSVFATWKLKAETKARLRCAAARERTCSESPHTPETFLTLHKQSPAVADVAVPRRLLHDLLAASEKPVSTPPLCVSPLGFHRCPLPLNDASVKVTVWKSVSKPTHEATGEPRAEDDGSGRSLAPSSSSDGISVNSVTTPFVPAAEGSTLHPRVNSAVQTGSGSSHDRGGGGGDVGGPPSKRRHAAPVVRELSPPPAIRILFPTNQTFTDTPSGSPAQRACEKCKDDGRAQTRGSFGTRSNFLEAVTAGRLASHRYTSSQPSRLPSSTAARRAIIMPTSSPSSPEHLEQQQGQPYCEAASPYPAEDVEALVERAKQLESDRLFLLTEVRKLSTRSSSDTPKIENDIDLTPGVDTHRCFTADCAADDGGGNDDRYERQQGEIRRLEAIVFALRDERRRLLKSMKHEIFQY